MADLKNERMQLTALESLFAQKRFPEAMDMAEKLVGQFPDSYHINLFYVKLLKETNRLGDADDTARNLMQLYPDNINLLSEMADVCLKLNKFDEAIEYYNKILFLDPFNTSAKESIDRIKALKTTAAGRAAKPVDFVSQQSEKTMARADTLPELDEAVFSDLSNVDLDLDDINEAPTQAPGQGVPDSPPDTVGMPLSSYVAAQPEPAQPEPAQSAPLEIIPPPPEPTPAPPPPPPQPAQPAPFEITPPPPEPMPPPQPTPVEAQPPPLEVAPPQPPQPAPVEAQPTPVETQSAPVEVAPPQPAPPEPETEPEPEPAAEKEESEFVTESAAELYMSQGLYDDALQIYQKLYAAQPDERHLLKIKQLNAHRISRKKIERLTEFLNRIRRKGENSV